MRRQLLPIVTVLPANSRATRVDGHLRDARARGLAVREGKSLASGLGQPRLDWLARSLLGASEYSFRDCWRVEGQIEEVANLFLNTTQLSQWWPQLARVMVVEAGGPDGNARSFAARANGFLPYALAIDFRVVRVKFPEQFAVELSGDLRGTGGGNLRQDGNHVAIDFDLRIRVARPMLHVLSLVARPALTAQHRWVMRQGELGLKNIMARRQVTGMPR